MRNGSDPYYLRTKHLLTQLLDSPPGAWDEHLPIAEAIVREAQAELGGVSDAVELPFVSWHDLRSQSPDEPDWILGRLIARGAVSLLAGKPKAGKSTVACAIAEAVDGG